MDGWTEDILDLLELGKVVVDAPKEHRLGEHPHQIVVVVHHSNPKQQAQMQENAE
jgi:hypothetical protein